MTQLASYLEANALFDCCGILDEGTWHRMIQERIVKIIDISKNLSTANTTAIIDLEVTTGRTGGDKLCKHGPSWFLASGVEKTAPFIMVSGLVYPSGYTNETINYYGLNLEGIWICVECKFNSGRAVGAFIRTVTVDELLKFTTGYEVIWRQLGKLILELYKKAEIFHAKVTAAATTTIIEERFLDVMKNRQSG